MHYHSLRSLSRILRFRTRVYGGAVSTTESSGAPISPHLLKLLVCPLSKEPLRYDKATNELVCDKLGVAYPIVEGIPHLVPGDGRVLESTVTPTDTTKTH